MASGPQWWRRSSYRKLVDAVDDLCRLIDAVADAIENVSLQATCGMDCERESAVQSIL